MFNPELGLGFFVVTNTNDNLCSSPTQELFDNIESFLVFDTHKGISSSLFFFISLTILRLTSIFFSFSINFSIFISIS